MPRDKPATPKKCPNAKWRLGSGKCMYKSKEKALRAMKAAIAKGGCYQEFGAGTVRLKRRRKR